MSLKLRLLLGLLVLSLLGFGVISTVNILFFRGIYLDFLRMQGNAITNFLRERVVKEIEQNPASPETAFLALGAELRSLYERQQDLEDLMIVDVRGKIVAHSNLQLIGSTQDPIPASLGLKGEPEGEIISWGESYLHFIPIPLRREKNVRFYLRISYPQKKITRILAQVQIRALLFSIFGLVLLIGATTLLYQKIAGRHFHELKRWLYTLNEGNFAEGTKTSPRDEEFREVWDLLQAMSSRLSSLFQKLQEEVERAATKGSSSLTHLDDLAHRGNQLSEELKELYDLVTRINEHVEKLKQGVDQSFADVDHHQQDFLDLSGGLLGELEESTSKLVQGVKELEKNIDELSQDMQRVEKVTGESVALTDEVASEVNELAHAIAQIRRSSELNKGALEDTVRESQRGMEIVSEVEQRVSSVSHAIEDVAGRVQNLLKQNERITEILGVIQQITERTNLLALNTAIIATQAGQHGGQFSVVAEEIRDLSQQVKRNAEEVFHLVGGIQEEITELSKSFSESSIRVSEGVERSRIAREVLNTIAQQGEKILAETNQIFKTLQDQNEAAQALTNSMAKFQGSLYSSRDSLAKEKVHVNQVQSHIKYLNDMVLRERSLWRRIQEKVQSLNQFFQELQKFLHTLTEEGEQSQKGVEGATQRVRHIQILAQEMMQLLRKIQGNLVELEDTRERMERYLTEKRAAT